MTVYRELLEAGYFKDGLSDEEKKKIADKVEGKRQPKDSKKS